VLVKHEGNTNNEYYYVYNGHGDVIQLVDSNGNIQNSYEYDEWGSITNQVENVKNPFKYTGEVYDEETGLYYLRSRYYDPSLGRFIQEDMYEGDITNPLTFNLYTYVYNNPLKYIDPSGNIGINQIDNLMIGLASSFDIDMLNYSTVLSILQIGKAIANGDINLAQLAKSAGASVIHPF
jgi:RHS repeat-associated protein